MSVIRKRCGVVSVQCVWVPEIHDDRRWVARYARDRLRDLDPSVVEEIVLMKPSAPGVLFGTGSESGVVLIYTRGNRAR